MMSDASKRSWRILFALLAPLASACSSTPVASSQPVAATSPTASAAASLACEKGTADCDKKPENSCEVKLDDSQQHCGACGKACDASEQCRKGACVRSSPLIARQGSTCLVQTLDQASPKSRVFCWGQYAPGEDGTLLEGAAVPREVAGFAGAKAVSISSLPIGCVVTAEGAVACWAMNEMRVLGGLSSVTSVAINGLNASVCAALRSGAAGCMDSFLIEGAPTTSVVAGVGDAISVSSNEEYACALLRSGKVSCWEHVDDAAPEPSASIEEPRYKTIEPTKVRGLDGAMQIATAGSRSCAATRAGTVLCWGGSSFDDFYEQSVGAFAAVPVAGITDAVEVAAGMFHACAVRKSGGVVCWGANTEGQLGANVSISSDTPVPVEGIEDAIHVAAGDEHTCIQRRSGAVYCWGSASEGRLGDGTRAEHATPSEVAGITDAIEVTASGKRTCATRKGGQVECWGQGYFDSFFDTMERAIPPSSMPGFTGAVSLSIGKLLECATTKSGETVCAGQSSLSAGRKNEPKPSIVLPNLRAARAVALEGSLGVALLGSGKAALWDARELRASIMKGTEKGDIKLRTLSIPGIADAVEIAIEQSTVCFRRRSGKIACARHVGKETFNEGFEKGPGKLTEVPDIRDAVQIVATKGKLCAVRKTGSVVCFNADGFPLPSGVKGPQRPLAVEPKKGIDKAVAMAMGRSFDCTLLSTGQIACSGDNYYGQLGAGDFDKHSDAVLVKGIDDAVSIAAGDRYACAARKTGSVVCWGSNDGDGAGHSNPAVSIRPVEVKGVLAAKP